MHARIAERIADAAALPPDAVVLEVGPGRGILTRALLARAKKVIAVETDSELVALLKIEFAQEIEDGRLQLIHADIRRFDLTTLPSGYRVVANIPYYLTGELFRMLLESDAQPNALTLLVQKEVAERIARSKKESIVSLSVKVYGEPAYEFTVKRGAFNPAPKVDSAILSVRNISRKRFASRAQEKRFFDLVHAGFAHKRKFVRSNLREIGVDPTLLSTIPEKARAEDLPLSTWLALARQ